MRSHMVDESRKGSKREVETQENISPARCIDKHLPSGVSRFWVVWCCPPFSKPHAKPYVKVYGNNEPDDDP